MPRTKKRTFGIAKIKALIPVASYNSAIDVPKEDTKKRWPKMGREGGWKVTGAIKANPAAALNVVCIWDECDKGTRSGVRWDKRIKWQTFSTGHDHWKKRNVDVVNYNPADHFMVVSEFILDEERQNILKEIRFVNVNDLSWIQPSRSNSDDEQKDDQKMPRGDGADVIDYAAPMIGTQDVFGAVQQVRDIGLPQIQQVCI